MFHVEHRNGILSTLNAGSLMTTLGLWVHNAKLIPPKLLDIYKI